MTADRSPYLCTFYLTQSDRWNVPAVRMCRQDGTHTLRTADGSTLPGHLCETHAAEYVREYAPHGAVLGAGYAPLTAVRVYPDHHKGR